MRAMRGSRSEPIAVVGVGCRLPGGADDPDRLWSLLANGRDAVAPIPIDRWDHAAWYDPDPAAIGKCRQREAGLLERIDTFDAAHFGISPREAEAMDPQQRVLLETVWQALEDAGELGHSRHGGRVGVFVGLYNDNYGMITRGSPDPARIGGWSASGTHTSVAAGRIAFTFDFTGPAVSVDTACSSSLVAVHLAIQSLRAGECDLAIAGGVHLLLSPLGLVASSKLGAASPDSRCKPFDARADGFGHAEGCGVVVLRRLGEVGGGRVRAVVSGSAVGQDGRSAGLTAPSGPAQVAVVRAALADAGLAAAAVDAIEAHGTGTALGDPIELHALAEVFAGRERPLWVGSVKSNIGHAEAAAGMAGLLKAVLMLERGAVPASLHFERLNPHIELGGVDIRVPTALEAVAPRAVGVSSFGFSGTNAHLVLTRAPAVEAGAAARPVSVLPLAARTETALEVLRQGYLARLGEGADWPSLAHTASLRQARLPWRLAVVAGDADTARAALAATAPMRAKGRPRLGFLVTGQGSAYAGMARGLLPGAPVLAEVLARCDAAMGLGRPLAELFEDGSALGRTGLAQPALFALAVGLGRQLRAWGIEPAALLGHSVGEYAAVVLAGVLPLEDGARLIARRAALMQALPAGGGMAALVGPRAAAEALLRRHRELEPAAWNTGSAMTVAGPLAALTRLEADPAVTGGELALHPLPVSHAFHSRLLEPMLDGLADAAAALPHAPPQVPVVGNLSGQVQPAWDGAYWRAHARAPVRFADGLRSLAGLGCELLVELGPQPVLAGFARSVLPGVPVLPTLARGREPWSVLLATLAELHRHGADPDWPAIDQPLNLPTTTAPNYPFERQVYWFTDHAPASAPPPKRMLGAPVEIATGGTVWSSHVAPDRPAFLGEHRVGEAVIVPGASHVAMLLAAAGGVPIAVADIVFVAPLALPETGRELQVLRDGDALSLFARGDDGGWVLHARAGLDTTAVGDPADLQAVLARCTPDEAGPEALYAMLDGRGIHLGPAFRGIRRLWRGTGEAVAEIELPAGLAEEAPELPIHPAALDACFQALGATFSGTGTPGAFLPFAIERVAFTSRCATRFHVHVRARAGSGTPDAAQGDLRLFDAEGRTIALIDGLSIARVRAEGGAGAEESGWAYRVTWEPLPLPAAALSPAAAELGRAAKEAAHVDVVATPEELGSGLEALAAAYAAEALARIADPATVDARRRRLFAHLPRMAAVVPAAGPAERLRATLEQRFGPVPEIAIAARCGAAAGLERSRLRPHRRLVAFRGHGPSPRPSAAGGRELARPAGRAFRRGRDRALAGPGRSDRGHRPPSGRRAPGAGARARACGVGAGGVGAGPRGGAGGARQGAAAGLVHRAAPRARPARCATAAGARQCRRPGAGADDRAPRVELPHPGRRRHAPPSGDRGR